MRKYQKPYRIKRKKSIFKKRFFWLGISVLVILGGIFYLVCFFPSLQVEKINISGNQKAPTKEIKRIIKERIGRNIIFISSRSILLVNFDKISKGVLDNFPQVAKVSLKRNFPNTITIEIEEREPVAVFSHNEDYFFIDREGIIFEEISPDSPGLLEIRNLAFNQTPNLGKRVVEKELLTQILEIELKIKENLKIPLVKAQVLSDERLNIETFEGWEIYLNPKEDFGWQLTKLKAVLEEEIPQERRKDLEYIELRFGNLAPYKYR